MISIRFDEYRFRVRTDNGTRQIFDEVRRKYVPLTPEEWVRQNWIHYLIGTLNYPRALLRVEMGIQLNEIRKRCDIVAFNRSGEPAMIVECKSPDVAISQQTFEQIARYNLALHVGYLIVSNGNQTYCCRIDFTANSFDYMRSIPAYEHLA